MQYTIRAFDAQTDYDFVWQLHLKENMPYIERHMDVSLDAMKIGLMAIYSSNVALF